MNTNEKSPNEVWNTQQSVAYLQIPVSQFENYVEEGTIPCTYVDGVSLFRPDEIRALGLLTQVKWPRDLPKEPLSPTTAPTPADASALDTEESLERLAQSQYRAQVAAMRLARIVQARNS